MIYDLLKSLLMDITKNNNNKAFTIIVILLYLLYIYSILWIYLWLGFLAKNDRQGWKLKCWFFKLRIVVILLRYIFPMQKGFIRISKYFLLDLWILLWFPELGKKISIFSSAWKQKLLIFSIIRSTELLSDWETTLWGFTFILGNC